MFGGGGSVGDDGVSGGCGGGVRSECSGESCCGADGGVVLVVYIVWVVL